MTTFFKCIIFIFELGLTLGTVENFANFNYKSLVSSNKSIDQHTLYE